MTSVIHGMWNKNYLSHIFFKITFHCHDDNLSIQSGECLFRSRILFISHQLQIDICSAVDRWLLSDPVCSIITWCVMCMHVFVLANDDSLAYVHIVCTKPYTHIVDVVAWFEKKKHDKYSHYTCIYFPFAYRMFLQNCFSYKIEHTHTCPCTHMDK